MMHAAINTTCVRVHSLYKPCPASCFAAGPDLVSGGSGCSHMLLLHPICIYQLVLMLALTMFMKWRRYRKAAEDMGECPEGCEISSGICTVRKY